MRHFKLLAACIGVASLSAVSAAVLAQQVVSFQVAGQKVVGTLELPANVSTAPVVLMLHGFTGSRNELATPAVKEGIFAHAAKAFAAQGLASLRIDFRGSGESEGQFEDTTLTGQAADALAAIDFLKTLKSVDVSRLSVVGWSQGGAVATMVAARSATLVRSVALWAPASVPAATYPAFLGVEYVKSGLASGGKAVSTKLPWGAEVSLKTAFFEDLYKVSPVAELARYSGPVFVAVGTNDPVVTPQPAMGQVLLSYHPGPGELWVRPMDHSFNAFVNATTLDEMVDATSAFIRRHSQ
ncbi:S9 family peptidase [Ideonella sp. A 288]|uniref:alpha/beta hydrolase family protein n=1 Tax=Ideonella sp. A 288 TaxID=1962181 RepID=UPI000B4B2082|nr:alpha/beta fold hydrolase [Ideonella sp. A 288]